MKAGTITNWKAGLFLASLSLIAAVLLYSFRLVDAMRGTTRRQLTIVVERYRDLLHSDDPRLALKAIQAIDFPIILADVKGNPLFWKNLPLASDDRSDAAVATLRKYIRTFDRQGNVPIPLDLGNGVVQFFHYGYETIILRFRWLTGLSIVAAVLLVLVGYYGFSAVRHAESRAMWIGIARETAHQFGTPVSSLMAWLEHLRDRYPAETVWDELERDVHRLQGVLARFSAIGKDEPPVAADLVPLVQDSVEYIRRRLPQKARCIELVIEAAAPVPVRMRPELIGWVLENLLRNAAEAIASGDGRIDVTVRRERRRGIVEIHDNGCGMTARERRAAFRTGYTTKEKGWGLGLSLAKRILVDEHRGSLTIVATGRDIGTTFRMELPLTDGTETASQAFRGGIE